MRAPIAAMLLVLSAHGAPKLFAQEPGRVLAQSGGEETWISRTEDGRRVTLRLSGEVRVSEAGDRIVFVEPDGFFTMIEETAEGTRRIDARRRGHGELEVSWWVDGAERPFDADAGAWLARMLEESEAYREERRRRMVDAQTGLRATRSQMQRALREAERARPEMQRALREAQRVRSEEVQRALREAQRLRVEAVEQALHNAEAVRADRVRAAERALRAAESARTGALERMERALREAEVVRERRLEEVMRRLEELQLHLRTEDGRRIWIL